MSPIVDVDAAPRREPDHPIETILVQRWSPRAMSGKALSEQDLWRLLEAARWAPSSYNIQPWRFIYALHGSEDFAALRSALVPANRAWAAAAGALLAIASLTTNPRTGKPAPTHSFDSGAAWMALALQGSAMGLVVHGMAGYDGDRLREIISLPQDHGLEAMVAIGHPGEITELPESLEEKEHPSDRQPIEAFAFRGRFPARVGT